MKHIRILLALTALLMGATLSATAQQFEQKPLQEALNPDGTLRQGAQGSFKVEGYEMRTDAKGRPVFVPQTMSTPGTWDTQFTLPNGTSGSVNAVATDGAGNWYVGGSFTSVGGLSVPVNNIARFNTATNAWSALGTGGGNGVNGTVFALAISGSDVFVGGNFTTANVGGTTVSANRVARFNTATNAWSALGTGGGNGVNDWVYALAISGSDVFVGGLFTTANVGGTTVAANRVARFNTATNAWSALGTGGGNGVDNLVFALAISGSNVFVGGTFTTANVGGTTVSVNNIARFNTATNAWSALGTGGGNGVNNLVNALAISGSDVFVGGVFTTANVGGTTVSVNNIARFNTATNAWSALGTGGGNGVDNQVNALAISGSDVFVGGVFTTANVGGTTVSANRVARFNTATNAWSALGTGGGNGVNNTVFALAISGSDVFVGGGFTTANVGGTTVSANYIARFNTASNTWSALGTGGGNGVDNLVYALAISGSDVFVGGFFTIANVGGTTVSVNNIARFNTATNAWSALGTGGGNGVNGTVFALAISGSDVFVGGDFTTANVGGTTVAANRVARFNTATNAWSALGTGGGNGVDNQVNALAISGSDVFVGGVFTTANVGGTTVSANRVARFNTATNAWSALGTGGGNGVNGTVRALAISGSDVFVGGLFTTANVGGTTVAANYIARFNTASNTWSALGTGGGNGVDNLVYALAISGSDVFVGGFFTIANVGGTTVSVNNIARFNTATNAWSALGTGGGNGVNSTVFALAISGSDVFVGGDFTTANVGGTTVSANRVARFNTATNAWSALGTGGGNGVNDRVLALAISGSDVFVGGFFTTANVGGAPVASTYIGRYFGGTVSVYEPEPLQPRTFLLSQNYPNPFNPTTSIRYELARSTEVKLEVYDMLGRKVATVVNARQEAGSYAATFNAAGLSSGVYFYRLEAGSFAQTKKMMLVK